MSEYDGMLSVRPHPAPPPACTLESHRALKEDAAAWAAGTVPLAHAPEATLDDGEVVMSLRNCATCRSSIARVIGPSPAREAA